MIQSEVFVVLVISHMLEQKHSFLNENLPV